MKRAKKTPKTVEKVIEKVVEETTEIFECDGGYEYLLTKEIVVITTGYIYTGICIGVNGQFLELENPSIIYETGPWTDQKWKDAQRLPTDVIRLERSQWEAPFELKRIVLK